ncbi:MAG TPA: helix-turn-helix transcriptional regulator [Gemmatimonadales bacterium]|nr:helix-turn-helix transcriptional regulator [Gemmatimonadales bacterium]
MAIQLRVQELLRARGMTPYRLAKASGGRISLSSAYRLARADGRFSCIRASVLEALCDIFSVGPGDVIECTPDHTRKAA